MSEEMTSRTPENGQITYANEVISTIVSVATTEVEGISSITGSGSITGIIGRGRAPRGVKVEMNGDKVSVDISVSVDYGIPIQKVGRNCQENVRKSIETMTGLTVERVDLHVVSVSFEKENQELAQGQRLALTMDGETAEEKTDEPQEAAAAEEAPDAGDAADEPEAAEAPAENAEDPEEAWETEEDGGEPEDGESPDEAPRAEDADEDRQPE